ncbi:MAG: CARDB domain-containing protein [Gemmatimonadales bacterium]
MALLALAGCKGEPTTGGLDPVTPGSLAIAISGLPGGAAANLTLTGPGSGGSSRSITASGTVANLTPGSYTLTANPVVAGGDGYGAAPQTQLISVREGPTVTSASVGYGIVTGRIALTLTGLPGGEGGSVSLSGPSGFTATATASGVVTGLLPGNYTVTAEPVELDGDHYEPTGGAQLILVTAGTAASPVTAGYRLTTGRLEVLVSGAPAGATPEVTVSGPDGFQSTLSGTTTLAGLVPGAYQVAAQSLSVNGDGYAPTIAPANVAVAAVPVPASASVSYALATASLTLDLVGLPAGVSANVTVTGPGGSQPVTASATLTGLAAGDYGIAAGLVNDGAAVYVPSPADQSVTLAPSPTPVSRTVTYARATGALQVTVNGLPGGVNASVTVAGPGGFNQTVTQTTTLAGLDPGSYVVTSAAVASGATSYVPTPSTQTVAVTTGASASATVSYGAVGGTLTVTVNGLPGGVPAAVTVIGPAGFSAAVTATTTLSNLVAGTYTVAAVSVTSGASSYAPSPTSQAAAVSVGVTVSRTVTYTLVPAPGSLAVTVSGLPGGALADLTVSGPAGYSAALTATQTLTGLTAGSYTIAAANVTVGASVYAPSPTSQSATVSSGATTNKTVTYALVPAPGSLTVTIAGLPGGALGDVTVTGPGGYSASVTTTQTLTGLTAGSYTVSAAPVTAGAQNYNPTPTSQSPTVPAGGSASATVSYAAGPAASLNLSIDGLYLTQAIQRYDGTVPLVAGRDAYLRVFVLANQANGDTPTVRVRFYSSGALVQTSTINAPGASVPTAADESSLSSSWNLLVPAALVQPNLTIFADVDPGNAVAEANETDNVFPVSGTPGAVDVRSLPTFNIRFVPVHQDSTGLTGNVTAGNQATFLVDPSKLLPIGAVSADVRSVYTTAAKPLQSSNGNGAWGTILSEVLALKSVDGNSKYYYGVVGTTYSSGVAGIGYVGGGARTALGWDKLPSGSGVMAHELGHNMGRSHAPCGGVASPDPSYPYAGAKIGVWGLDLSTLALKSPATYVDLMSYCSPEWVSDYNWNAMVQYRQAGPNNAPVAGGFAGATGSLLVFGRATASGLVLEPALPLSAPVSGIDPTSGYAVEGLTIDGRVLFRYGLATVRAVDDRNAEERHFAAVLPVDPALQAALAGIRLVTPGGTTVRFSAQAVAARARQLLLRDPSASLTRPNAAQAELRWDAATYPMAMVRDEATGEVLSFARGGRARVFSRTGRVTVTFSDGVKAVARQLR